MKHKQFKTGCKCTVEINERIIECDTLEQIKKTIYQKGKREKIYYVFVKNKKNDLIYDVYIYKYTKEGPIFRKQIYSRWIEDRKQAEKRQYKIFLTY